MIFYVFNVLISAAIIIVVSTCFSKPVVSFLSAPAEAVLVLPQFTECRPLSSLVELESWKPDEQLESCRGRIPLDRNFSFANHAKTLVCHDMMGGYLDSDK